MKRRKEREARVEQYMEDPKTARVVDDLSKTMQEEGVETALMREVARIQVGWWMAQAALRACEVELVKSGHDAGFAASAIDLANGYGTDLDRDGADEWYDKMLEIYTQVDADTPRRPYDDISTLQWALMALMAVTCPPEDLDIDLARKLHSNIFQTVGREAWDETEAALRRVRQSWERDEEGVRTRWLESWRQNHPAGA